MRASWPGTLCLTKNEEEERGLTCLVYLSLTRDSLGGGGSARKITATRNLVFPLIIAVDSIIAMILDSGWVITRSVLKDVRTISSVCTSIVYVLLKHWVTQSIFTCTVSSSCKTDETRKITTLRACLRKILEAYFEI